MFIHEKGSRTLFLPEILAHGLAPHNLQEYAKQQFRWARGSLEIIFKYNPLFRRGLTWAQKMQYLYSAGYYLNGVVVLLDALIPVVVLLTGLKPVNESSTNFIAFFFPFMFLTMYILMASTDHTVTFRALQLSISSFYVFIKAMISTIFGVKVKFEVTSKEASTGNFLKLAVPHFTYIAISMVAIVVGIMREGFIPSVITNISWIVFNIVFFSGFIRVAYPWKESFLFNLSHLKNVIVSEIVAKSKVPFIRESAYAYADEKVEVKNGPKRSNKE